MSIELREISKIYDGQTVVSKVSLEVGDGELFVLLGSSGSGKSTVLRMIAGLIRPDSGSIHLGGRDVTHLPAQARGTGFVFQNYSNFRHMTVAQNIEFGLLVRGQPACERSRRSDELMELVELTGLGGRYPHQLSGGQQQRVALARALAYRPAVLLLDEPFAALDAKIRLQLRGTLKEIQRKLGVTTILVTHDQEEGFELGDRIGVMERGNLVEVGLPEDLYHCPSSQYVATFVGGGNVLVGRLKDGQIQLGSIFLPMPDSAPPHQERSPVRVLIRPENLVVGQPGRWPLGTARVVQRTFLGSAQRFRLETPSLQGVRTVAPPPAYGQNLPQLEAVAPTQAVPTPTPLMPGALREVEIGVSHFHVLERTGLKTLIVANHREAMDFGCRFAEAARASATLLQLGLWSPKDPLRLLAREWSQRMPELDHRSSSGPPEDAVLREIRPGLHEIVVLGKDPGHPLGALAVGIIQRSDVPVMVIQKSRPQLERILICSRGGEPGKADVWMGGRIAKRVGATARVVRVLPGEDPRRPLASRDEDSLHLERARASLESLGVSAEVQVLVGAEVTAVLLGELNAAEYDLVVLGLPHSTDGFSKGIAARLLAGSEKPFLFVPMHED